VFTYLLLPRVDGRCVGRETFNNPLIHAERWEERVSNIAAPLRPDFFGKLFPNHASKTKRRCCRVTQMDEHRAHRGAADIDRLLQSGTTREVD